MKTIESMPLSALVRFGLTGLIGVILFFVIPIAIYNPGALETVADFGGAISVFAIAFTTGFVIDGLKLYQFSRGYKRRRAEFMRRLAHALEVQEEDAPAYFVKAAQLERERGMGQVDFVHSRWVMFDVTSKLFFLASALWGSVGLIQIITRANRTSLALMAVSVICFLIALRLVNTAGQEQRRVEDLYIHFFKRHKDIILGSDIIQ